MEMDDFCTKLMGFINYEDHVSQGKIKVNNLRKVVVNFSIAKLML